MIKLQIVTGKKWLICTLNVAIKTQFCLRVNVFVLDLFLTFD